MKKESIPKKEKLIGEDQFNSRILLEQKRLANYLNFQCSLLSKRALLILLTVFGTMIGGYLLRLIINAIY